MNSESKKCWGKNRRKKVRKFFLYSHEYRYQKMGEGNALNNFNRNTRIVRAKNVRKNRRKKVPKTFFYIHTNIVTKKWGEKIAK